MTEKSDQWFSFKVCFKPGKTYVETIEMIQKAISVFWQNTDERVCKGGCKSGENGSRSEWPGISHLQISSNLVSWFGSSVPKANHTCFFSVLPLCWLNKKLFIIKSIHITHLFSTYLIFFKYTEISWVFFLTSGLEWQWDMEACLLPLHKRTSFILRIYCQWKKVTTCLISY